MIPPFFIYTIDDKGKGRIMLANYAEEHGLNIGDSMADGIKGSSGSQNIWKEEHRMALVQMAYDSAVSQDYIGAPSATSVKIDQAIAAMPIAYHQVIPATKRGSTLR